MIILFDYNDFINIPINFILEHLILTTYHLAVRIYLTIHPSIDISLYTYFSFAFIFCWNVITQQIYENFMTEEILLIWYTKVKLYILHTLNLPFIEGRSDKNLPSMKHIAWWLHRKPSQHFLDRQHSPWWPQSPLTAKRNIQDRIKKKYCK